MKKQNKQQKKHGRRRKSNGQHSASHKPIKGKRDKLSNSVKMERGSESLFQTGVQLLENSQHRRELLMAKDLLTQAANQGHVGAQVHLGKILAYEGRHGKGGDTESFGSIGCL